MPNEDLQPLTSLEGAMEKIRELHRLYSLGQLKGPEQHEVNPGLAANSKENYLYFTLPSSINFQRHSPRLWASALNTFNAPDTNFLFRPEEVGVASSQSTLESKG